MNYFKTGSDRRVRLVVSTSIAKIIANTNNLCSLKLKNACGICGSRRNEAASLIRPSLRVTWWSLHWRLFIRNCFITARYKTSFLKLILAPAVTPITGLLMAPVNFPIRLFFYLLRVYLIHYRSSSEVGRVVAETIRADTYLSESLTNWKEITSSIYKKFYQDDRRKNWRITVQVRNIHDL